MSAYGYMYPAHSNGHDSTPYDIDSYVIKTETILQQPMYSTYVDEYNDGPLTKVEKVWHKRSTSPVYNHPQKVEEFIKEQHEASKPDTKKFGPPEAKTREKVHGPDYGYRGRNDPKGYIENKDFYEPGDNNLWKNHNYGDDHRKNHNMMEPISTGKQARPTHPTWGSPMDSSRPSKPKSHVGSLSKQTNDVGAPVDWYYGDKYRKNDSTMEPSSLITTGKQARPNHPTWDSPTDSLMSSKPKNHVNFLSKPTNGTDAGEYLRESARPSPYPVPPNSKFVAPTSTGRKMPESFGETIDSNEAARLYVIAKYNELQNPPEMYKRTIDCEEAARKYGGVML